MDWIKTLNPFMILRFGLGITFLLIGISIWQEPELWGSFLQPWAASLAGGPTITTMMFVAILDIALGILLIIGLWTEIVALIAALHLLSIIIGFGYNDIAVRDFGLLTAALALSVHHFKDKPDKKVLE